MKIIEITLKTLKIIWNIIKAIFLTYAVLFSIICTVLGIYIGLSIAKPIIEVKKLRTMNPVKTLYMSNYLNTLQNKDKEATLEHVFVPLDSISLFLIKSVLAAEDDGFYTHPGFDLAAILRAFEHNMGKNRLSHGASTITQQMAKNIFVGGEKSFTRKYRELAYTILMESILGKDRILELYLNYAQWGKNIFGCEAAAQHYYKKSAKNLSINQATRLAAILAKPCKLNPHYQKSIFIKKRLRVIGDNLYRRHIINDSTYIDLAGTDSLIFVLKKKSQTDSVKFDTSLAHTHSNNYTIKKAIARDSVQRQYIEKNEYTYDTVTEDNFSK